ncbi:hypothetical protein N431DRAFT_434143 [Stipitochalara longipes BDJ]|nr:hypothetical protein N431DRAFT_434143 [Stipitochalara longipes BDJ]
MVRRGDPEEVAAIKVSGRLSSFRDCFCASLLCNKQAGSTLQAAMVSGRRVIA